MQLSTARISDDGLYRYQLRRVWHSMTPPLVFIMLNPSTADASVDDPTVRRCMGFAHRDGYGGIIVLNLYALRATDPKALRTAADPVGPENDVYLAAAHSLGAVVAAWGAHPFALDRAIEVRKLLHNSALCLGITKSGAPRHPLYVKGDQPLIPLPELAA